MGIVTHGSKEECEYKACKLLNIISRHCPHLRVQCNCTRYIHTYTTDKLKTTDNWQNDKTSAES
jgi:hypothetical protein